MSIFSFEIGQISLNVLKVSLITFPVPFCVILNGDSDGLRKCFTFMTMRNITFTSHDEVLKVRMHKRVRPGLKLNLV